jgi:hypothetical protein
MRTVWAVAFGTALVAALLTADAARADEPTWSSPNRYRVLLRVDPRGPKRSQTAASVELDLARELARAGGSGTIDDATIEVVAYEDDGRPVVFDPTREGAERFLLPWRLERDYAVTRATLHFVVPSGRHTRYAAFFDTVDSGRSRPERYPGPVGDGDLLSEGYGRREIGPSGYDAMVDIDGDGDLDLLSGGIEPFVRVYENVGGSRFVARGRLTSAAEPLLLPHDAGNRSWLTVSACDWDGDGDVDLFVHVWAGPDGGSVYRYENTTERGGPLTFTPRGALQTTSGQAFPEPIDFIDWDGDGRLDVLSMSNGALHLFRNTGGPQTVAQMSLADGTPILANGVPLALDRPRFDAADIDGDADLDLIAGTDDGRIYLFENVGTRNAPVLRTGRAIVHFEWMDCRTGVKVVDWDGDGQLDLLTGRYWERTRHGEQPRVHGRLYANVGTRERPRFSARDARSGAPFVEGLLTLDALRQNAAAVSDWDGDGRLDLIVGDSDGFVSFFRNRTGGRAPLFDAGVRLEAGGTPIKVWGELPERSAAGYARPAVVDWDEDGRLDLIVADGRGWVTFFRNEGTPDAPRLTRGERLTAGGRVIDGSGRTSVIACDWDGDRRRDLLLAMSGERGDPMSDWGLAKHGLMRGILFFPNRGTRGRPQLDVPRWVRAGPQRWPIDLERPNLGACVDWDRDGLLDLVACEFESDIRLFRNTSQDPQGRPRLGGPAQGETLYEAWSREMISGADAVDFDGDGDPDIVTGQGHGGSGIRFFARGYLDDWGRKTLPLVAVERSERSQNMPRAAP